MVLAITQLRIEKCSALQMKLFMYFVIAYKKMNYA